MPARPGPKPKQTIDLTWRPDLAYVVGLITTDGCLSSDGRHIIFVSKDLQLIQTFCRCLNIQPPIRQKRSGFGTNSFFISFSAMLFWNWLRTLGLTPRKSKSLGALYIPQNFFFDFLRGCFDGDGSVYSYMDSRWHQSFMFYTSFCSASRTFLLWIQQSIYRAVGVQGSITNGSRVSQLKFAKQASLAIIKRMYYNPRVPCLQRKKNKLKRILRKEIYYGKRTRTWCNW